MNYTNIKALYICYCRGLKVICIDSGDLLLGMHTYILLYIYIPCTIFFCLTLSMLKYDCIYMSCRVWDCRRRLFPRLQLTVSMYLVYYTLCFENVYMQKSEAAIFNEIGERESARERLLFLSVLRCTSNANSQPLKLKKRLW